MDTVVYLLVSPNGRAYVGRTNNFDKRMYEHGYNAQRKLNHCKALEASIRKHGIENFHKEVICRFEDPSIAGIAERWMIAIFGTLSPHGYNLTIGGEGVMLGKTHTPEARAKISAAGKGRPYSEEAKLKQSIKLKGRKKSKETRKRMSEGRKGMKFTDEHKANMSKANLGKILTEEHRRKMSEAHKLRWARIRAGLT